MPHRLNAWRRVRLSVSLAGSLLASTAIQAQPFPDHPIKLIVPFGAGSAVDTIARVVGAQVAEQINQSVVIDNRTGANGIIAAEMAAKAPADGYTLFMPNDGIMAANPALYPHLPYDPLKDFAPVTLASTVPLVLVSNPSFVAKTVPELIAAAKAHPGKYTISSANVRMFVELLNSRANIKLLHIPYKGGALAASDAIAGQVDMVYAGLPVLLPFIQSGKLKALAVTSTKRSTALPKVPTIAELGINYEINIRYTVYAPAGIPRAVQDKLIKATQKVTAEKDFKARLLAAGIEADSAHPEKLEEQAREELAMWKQVAKDRPDLVTQSK